SPETVRRFLRDEGARYVKLKTTPPLTDNHKARRLSFARQHLQGNTDFRNWVWSDEKRFCLDGPDGLFYTWNLPEDQEQLKTKRAFNGGGVMVWGAIRHDHTVALVEVTVRMNSAAYQEILSNHFLPHWEEFKAQGIVFQQDNAPCHSSRSTAEWLRASGVTSVQWPALSPDLSPIENIWGYMGAKTSY
ncbi:hypothetical protein FOL46_006112, partial [Perkinsus olseni]